MSNFLTCTKRAPLKLAMQYVRNVHRNIHLHSASCNVNHAVVSALHSLGWRQRDYIAAVKRSKKQSSHCTRPFKSFK